MRRRRRLYRIRVVAAAGASYLIDALLRIALMDAYSGAEVQRDTIHRSVQGWINHVRYGNTWGLRKAMLKRVRL